MALLGGRITGDGEGEGATQIALHLHEVFYN